MYDQTLFLKTLSRFAVVLPAHYDLVATLTELTESVVKVLDLSGSGVSIAEDGRLRFVTAVNQASTELEHAQERYQEGPCRSACDTGEVVRVADVRAEYRRWPHFLATATRVGVAGVAAIPMRLDDQVVGALNLYSALSRQWSDGDMKVAAVLADMATSYLVNASKLRQQQQLTEQLQQALESRVVIEQAKGITAHQRSISIDEAYERMRRHAVAKSTNLQTVAEAIVAVGLRV